MLTNAEMRELLITARADTYDAHQEQRRTMLADASVPDEAIAALVAERNTVWDEFTKRINDVPVNDE